MNAQWRLSAWYFAYFAFIGAFLPYFSLYLESLGLSPARIGMLMALGQAMRLVAPTIWGWLSDRSGRRTPIVRWSAAASVLAFSTYFFVSDFFGLLLATALLHLFWSASLPLVEALTFAHLSARPERYGRIRLWGSLGFILAVTGIGSWLDHWPLQSLLWCGLALLVLTAIVAGTLLEAQTSADHHTLTAPSRLRDRRVLALLLAGFFMSAAHGPLYVFFTIHLVDHGYGKALAGALWSLGVVAEIGIFLLMPRLSRRYGFKQLLGACFALAILRFVLIGWYIDILILMALAQLLHAFTFGVHHVVSVATLNQWFAAEQQGRIQALYGSLSFGAGGMLGALLAGQSWQVAGAAPTYTLAAGFAVAGLLVVLLGLPSDAAADAPVR